jgi:hypothetical protein
MSEETKKLLQRFDKLGKEARQLSNRLDEIITKLTALVKQSGGNA